MTFMFFKHDAVKVKNGYELLLWVLEFTSGDGMKKCGYKLVIQRILDSCINQVEFCLPEL
jgi:hypothetical protein